MRCAVTPLIAGLMMTGITLAAPPIESPESMVQAIYEDWGKTRPELRYWMDELMSPETRHSYFTPEIIRVLEIKYVQGIGSYFDCEIMHLVNPVNQDWDLNEIHRTMQLDVSDVGGRRIVDARFTSLGGYNHLRYEFVNNEGGWRIADIASFMQRGDELWRLSELHDC